MINKELVEATELEATKLRTAITQEESQKLSFSRLNPTDTMSCIYGQLAGYCANERAHELMQQCAPTCVVRNPMQDWLADLPCNYETTEVSKLVSRKDATTYYSPIEAYIAQEDADNKQLIDFIKGKIDKIDLSSTINC